jgi:hypothetical protein
MVLIYKYKKVEKRPISEGTRTPLIPITIRGSLISIDTTAIPDSGADITAVPIGLAEAIGLDLTAKKEKCVGIGGWVDSIPSKMDIGLGNEHEKYNFLIPVKVILDKYEFPILLGRNGFFDKFIISFDESEGKVTLKRKNATPRLRR